MKQNYSLLNFNRGMVSPLAFARSDIERISLSAETQENFIPRVLGSMSLRQGFGYIDSTKSNAKAYHLKFIYDEDDAAIIEATAGYLRFRVNETVVTRPSVSSVINNGSFTGSISGWSDNDDSGCVSSYATGDYLSLVGTEFNYARVRQQVSVAAGDYNKDHAINVSVYRGIANLKLGSSAGNDDLFPELSLGEGVHSIVVSPTTDIHIELSSNTKYATLVNSCTIESSGDFVIETPYGSDDLKYLRYDQSGDVVYVACKGFQQYKITRQDADSKSWSYEKFLPEDGPFKAINTTKTSLTASALSGDITLTASQNLFKSTSVGTLYKVASIGQKVTITVPYPAGSDQWSDSIRVTGVGTSRAFTVERTGTWTGTIYLQKSVGEEGSWVDDTTYTTNASVSYNDGLDNQIVYYRIGVKSGGLSSGTSAILTLTYASGSIDGICRITGYTSATSVSAIVLKDFGSLTSSDSWYEGYWSERRGYPTAVALHEGRLFWGGQSHVYPSVSDSYESYDDSGEGDDRAFVMAIPSGPSETVNWLLSMKRLMVGTQYAEWYVRSSTQDEILTPANANMKATSTYGSSSVQAMQVDNVGMFVQRSTTKLLKSGYTIESDDYKSEDLTKIVPEILQAGISRIDIQRIPDTRVHCVLEDGTAAILIHDELEDVKGWVKVSTDGFIEDVIIMPAIGDDTVYYCVRRNINGSDVRYLEKWSLESECIGGTLNKQADSFIVYSGVPTLTVAGLDHLEGESVVVWADGQDLSPLVSGVQTTYLVSGGQVTLTQQVENAVVGLPYTATYKSTKLVLESEYGTSLFQKKKISSIGLLLQNTHNKGVLYGDSFDTLDDMPLVEDHRLVDEDEVYSVYDEDMFEFDGDYDTDSRICLKAMAPRPCNILACVVQVSMNEKFKPPSGADRI